MNRAPSTIVLALAVGCSSSAGEASAPPQDDPAATSASAGGGAPSSPDAPGQRGPSPRQGCKRGVAYGYHSEADLRALSRGIAWWYNWAFEPDAKVRNVFGSLGVEYVPMVWGTKVDASQVDAKILPSATALLGYNEPNFVEQANLSAKAAAARWPEVEAVAAAHALTLVSPAVNFCGGACVATNPFDYLDDFFAACSGCRVDAVAIHIYVGCQGENGNHAQWLINHVKTYERRFTQPLWLTEFACNDAKNEDEQKAFLVDAVTYLESDPRIQRYAWFAGRADNVPHVDLLGADGQLTALGKAYVELPHDGACAE